MVDYSSRLRRLREGMKSAGLDCALLSSSNDIYYYTGYRITEQGSVFLKVGMGSRPVMYVSPLENGASDIRTADVKPVRKLSDMALPKVVGFDEHATSAAFFTKLKNLSTLKPAAGIFKGPRAVKDSHEIAQMRKALDITKRALDRLESEGKTEAQVAKEADIIFRESGADNAFDTIVASGENSAFVHHRPDDRKIKRKDLVVIDLGARLNGYCSDISRTFCQSPGRREKELFENIKTIQDELIGSIKPGTKFSDVEKLYERLMKKSGYKVMHGFGHGVGLNVHERIEGKLKEGMVITVEPGAYLKGFGGCRIEDMVLVKKKPEILSKRLSGFFNGF